MTPGVLAQLALDGVDRVAMVDRGAGGEPDVARVLVRLVADDRDAVHALGAQLRGDLRHRDLALELGAFDRLAAGHRDRPVRQDLVGDVHPGRDGGTDRQQAGMEVGAVAQVLEHVAGLGERRRADPVGAFAAHLRDGERRAIRQPHRHAMAADSAEREAVVGHDGRAVVGAARAEGREAHQAASGDRRRGGDRRATQLELGRCVAEPAAQRCREKGGRELAFRGHQRGALQVLLAPSVFRRLIISPFQSQRLVAIHATKDVKVVRNGSDLERGFWTGLLNQSQIHHYFCSRQRGG